VKKAKANGETRFAATFAERVDGKKRILAAKKVSFCTLLA